MRKCLIAVCGALAATAALLPAPAWGVTVDGGDFEDGVLIDDAEGKPNRLTVRSGVETVTVRESGPATLRATGSCRRRSARLVVCSEVNRVYINAGRGDDAVTYTGGVGEIHGGAGDDVLRAAGPYDSVFGGDGRDVLFGGAQEDDLSGGRGADRLHGGAGDDTLYGEGRRDPTGGAGFRGSGDDDVLDGGRGRDFASWAERRDGVRADLSKRYGGGRGERDVLRSIEHLSGGVGNDRLVGDDRANVLLGSNGRDVLIGRGGDDVVGAGTASTIFGDATDGSRDTLSCGRGSDRVDFPALDPLARDCERFSDDATGTLNAQPLAEPTNRLLFETICPGSWRECERRIVLLRDGVEIARSETVVVTSAQTARIAVQLPGPLPRGVIEVRHEGTNSGYGDGEPVPHEFRYRLAR